jgi:hypothetical protein
MTHALRVMTPWQATGTSRKKLIREVHMLYTECKFHSFSTFLVVTIIFLSSFLQCGASGTIQMSDNEIDAKLFELKPLPKIHYCWPPDANLLETRDSRRLYELARIMLDVIRFSELCAAKLRTIYE